MRSGFLFLFLICFPLVGLSQYSISFLVIDHESNEPIVGAKVILQGTRLGAITDTSGQVTFDNIPDGENTFQISFIGYSDKTFTHVFPLTDNVLTIIELEREEELDVVVVEATRSNRSIEDLPTRTEVLTEEIDEAASMEPSKISHLITHSTGIQVQTTSAGSNGAVVRMQGLNGRYTQILKDGFPLYGGFSGSLDVLQIPPLDLRQVEFVKGSASTLYGGGAIGGLINLLSKKPDADETLLHMNLSHIGSRDMNFFASKKWDKWGFTNLASFHLHNPYDADNDGYSDIPEVLKVNFNPRLFFYPDDRSQIYLGAMFTMEDRIGGDMLLIDDGPMDANHFYFDSQETNRITTQISAYREFKNGNRITFKNSVSSFERYSKISMNPLGEEANFAGRQNNSFSEFNFNVKKPKHNIIFGLNVYTDEFKEREIDTSALRNQQFFTYGLFVNHLWDAGDKLSLETGLRTDFAIASGMTGESGVQPFVLPRISLLYKVAKPLSLRLGGGMGYRMPTVFTEDAEPLGYRNVKAVDFLNVKAERSYNGNFDIKFVSNLGSKNILLTLNQMFYYNVIDNPILLNIDQTGGYAYENANGLMQSRGFESQVKFTFWWFTLFVGYTYNDAFIEDGGIKERLILAPQHSIKGDLLFVVDGKWRIGLDYEYKSKQVLSTGLYSRDLFMSGVIVERTINRFVIFLNAENFTDTRQTRYESILTSPYNTPQYTDIWAPLDGFFFNAGLKIKF